MDKKKWFEEEIKPRLSTIISYESMLAMLKDSLKGDDDGTIRADILGMVLSSKGTVGESMEDCFDLLAGNQQTLVSITYANDDTKTTVEYQ